ncbi:MAG: penicillin-binding transpeptidase domain-containing protein [Phycisphaerae bacterium]|nr:penicillin-binding transpeptidase domain-containing protein [Phycisphaerae bacterium]
MYDRRLKIFAFLCFLFAAACVVRLAYIQLNPRSAWQSQLEKIYASKSKELPALRGKILDRNGKILAADEAKFALCIDYNFARLADERFWQAQLLRALDGPDAENAGEKIRKKFIEDFNTLSEIIYRCAQFENLTFEQVKEQINRQINEPIWQLRYYLAWKRKYPDKEFETAVPDADERLLLAAEIDVAEMHQSQELFKLENDDEVLAAQLKFLDTSGVQIQPRAQRYYPFKSSASQLIGWVRLAAPADNQNLRDESGRYMYGETIGFCGVEYVFEPYLRGSRGKVVYDTNKEILSKTETRFGGDVKLTIDIELQRKIENILKNRNLNPCFGHPAAVVVIDVNSTDILALVSLPDFDLNKARWDYSKLLADGNKPVVNRAIEEFYPPGSTVKPVILAAALAGDKITGDQIISCPSHPSPAGWPNCWILKTLGYGHDEQWANEGGNKARNALRGSCNIYFSQLADRISPESLQKWLFSFGFGKNTLQNFRQVSGIISSSVPQGNDLPFDQLPGIDPAERRFFGIGHGNFRTTVLQVANVFATLAREGVFKKARIVASQPADAGYNLGLNENILSIIYDGTHAVVSEQGGTAFKQFADSGFEEKGIKVFGKTGSTEKPYDAWFAGFAKDSLGKSVAFAVLIEGGQHGASDAGPIARDLLSFCIELGYLK